MTHFLFLGTGLSAQPLRGNLSVPTQSQSKGVITHQQYVDETNEEVQKLLEAEMGTVEECIRAIELYGTAAAAAPHMEEEEAQLLENNIAGFQEHLVPDPSASPKLVEPFSHKCTWPKLFLTLCTVKSFL